MRAGAIPAAVSAAKAPMSGLAGVLETLATITFPASTATRSVNVPPTSIPTRMYNDPLPAEAWQSHFRVNSQPG